MTFDEGLADAGAIRVDGDGEPLDEAAVAELASLDAEAAAHDEPREEEERERLVSELASTEAALDAERTATRAALERYREALLTAEPELPPDLVQGETLEELEDSLAAARGAVARIRDRLQADDDEAPSGGGFPVGAPARGGASRGVLTSAEKIAAGLRERER
jgi:hypothetical protein